MGSRRAAERVLASITQWIKEELRLEVNAGKSGVGRPWERKFLGFRLNREGRIEAARFLAYGCPPTLVCGSALAEMIAGMTVEAALKLTRKEILRAVGGLSAQKRHAAALAIETLRKAVEKKSA